MAANEPLAHSLEEASILLDGHHSLVPHTPEYERLYVERPQVESDLIREAIRAERGGHPFYWCFTGHTGSGKSTELNRIMVDRRLGAYLPVRVDLEAEFDIHNVAFTDLLLAMGRACAEKADELRCPVPEALRKAIARWGAEILTEEELQTRTEGHAGLKVSLPFLALGEEVRSGGGKRETIRRKISNDVLEFTRLIDELAAALETYTHQRVLCVLDGLDHLDAEPAFKVLNDHFLTVKLPQISKVFVVPLALLNTDFLNTIERRYSTVPNVKVFQTPGVEELDDAGFRFYQEVISRYVSIELFSEEALRSLCRLSAGILRDMIRNTGDACGYAADAGSPRVTTDHVESVWNQMMRFYRNQLRVKDYEALEKVASQPLPRGIDGVPPLLNSKAVVFYPNGEGWYGVHPAVQRLMAASAALSGS
ncbi:MAG TPA: hypothetical protein VGG06_35300 [Thermoanaerobaculia bacterium]|jgi:hypothetical protein